MSTNTKTESINLRQFAASRLAQVAQEKREQIAQTTSTHRLQALYGVNGPRLMSNGVFPLTRPKLKEMLAATVAPRRPWFSTKGGLR